MRVYCDTHVHCYQFEYFEQLLEAAYENLSQQALADKVTEESCFLLFFTDGKTDKTWGKILNAAKTQSKESTWSLEFDQPRKLIHASNGKRVLVLAPGRQINSVEGLEFLLLGCVLEINEGACAAEIIEKYQQYVVICPWGVGKWLGARGRTLSGLIAHFGESLILGDNACRPNFWRKIRQFHQTRNPILNGSDPLPLKGEIAGVGRFSLSFELADGDLNLEAIVRNLKSASVEKRNFGGLTPFLTFVKSRWGLFYRKL